MRLSQAQKKGLITIALSYMHNYFMVLFQRFVRNLESKQSIKRIDNEELPPDDSP